MVKALDLGKIASNPTLPAHPEPEILQKLTVAPTGQISPFTQPSQSKPSAQPSPLALSPSTQNKPAQNKSQLAPAQKQPQAQPLAISSGTADSTQQPIAQNIAAVQIAAVQIAAVSNEWSGASFPVEDFQEYTSPFGYRSSPYGGYSQEFHYGLDMAAPEGSYVRNWWPGRVVEVTDNTNCGTSVVLESGPWTHIYCHMQGHVEQTANGLVMIDREGGIQVAKGQDIPAGARIGRVGMTGRTTGPHLHWGLKYESNWVDPALVLRAMYSNQQAFVPGDRSSQ
ncbi:MAG: peptidoglycan DD-metalloendopeptidase family protein [Leptolyngbyaceae cyanobacterium CSU_1_4]|nr:peptidoglycan DD-metalloendopeptidase family protein [Leptolyngbyaceae cyanobacterium CSU_1_4]